MKKRTASTKRATKDLQPRKGRSIKGGDMTIKFSPEYTRFSTSVGEGTSIPSE